MRLELGCGQFLEVLREGNDDVLYQDLLLAFDLGLLGG